MSIDLKVQSMETLISGFVARRHVSPERQAILDEILVRIHARKSGMQDIVLLMEKPLTSEEGFTRETAMILLSQLIDGIHDIDMTPKHVKFYAQFLAERLQDPPCVHPSIQGLRALALSRQFDSDTAIICVESIVGLVDIQSQPYEIRHAAFSFFARMIERNLDDLKVMRSEFVVGFLASADGEVDPRNLVLIFPVLKLLPNFDGWDRFANDIFETFSSYFPMIFTPPPDSPASITQDELLKQLQEGFMSSVLLVDRTVQLMVDKMQPTASNVARLQALHTLTRLIERYPDRVNGDIIWRDGLYNQILVESGKDINKAAISAFRSLLRSSKKRSVISMIANVTRELNQRMKDHDDGTMIEPLVPLIADGVLRSTDEAADLFVRAVVKGVIAAYNESYRVGKKTHLLVLCRYIAEYVARRDTEVNVNDVDLDVESPIPKATTEFDYSLLVNIFIDALNLGEAAWSMRQESIIGITALIPVMTKLEAMSAAVQLSSVLVALSMTPAEGVKKAALAALETMQRYHPPAVITTIATLFAEIERCHSAGSGDAERHLVDSIAVLGASEHDEIFTSVASSLIRAASTGPITSSVACDALTVTLTANAHNDARMEDSMRCVCSSFLVATCYLDVPHDALVAMAKTVQAVVQACSSLSAHGDVLDAVIALVVDGDASHLIRVAQASTLIACPESVATANITKANVLSSPLMLAIVANLLPAVTPRSMPIINLMLEQRVHPACIASVINKLTDATLALELAGELEQMSHEAALLSTRALLMRGHESGQAALIRVLQSDSAHVGLLLLGDLDGGALSEASGAIVTTTYKKDVVEYLLPRLLEQLSVSLSGDPDECTRLLASLGDLLTHVPISVVIPRLEHIYTFVRQALNGDSVAVMPMLETLLGMLGNARQFFVEHAEDLASLLMRHATKSEPASLRILALSVLESLHGPDIPGHVIMQVRHGLDAALGDRKRAVRRVARDCRQVWE